MHEWRAHIAPLRSSIDANFSNEPPRHIDVTIGACHQKSRSTILYDACSTKAPLGSQYEATL
jgi:hypothetical protein